MNKKKYEFIIEESSSSMGQNIYKWLLNKSDLVKEGHQVDSTFGQCSIFKDANVYTI